jgi:hypothetical protein
VNFKATITVKPGKGAGVPTGSVTFRLASTNCTDGSILETDPADGTGVAEINVTSASLNVTGSPHNIRACFDNTDGNFTDSEGTDTHAVQAATTTVVASVPTMTPQYSDEMTLKATITPHSILGSELTGVVRFYFGASTHTCAATDPGSGAPVAESAPIAEADDGVGQVDYQVLSAAGAYKVTACFYSSNANFAHGNDSEDVTVATEDASVASGSPYDNAFSIGSGTTATFSLQLVVRETNAEPDANAGALPGDIDKAGLTVTLSGIGGGGNITGTCSPTTSGTGYGMTKSFLCNFANVPVDAYEVIADVTGTYYHGDYFDALTVYDPNAGFVTGGGKFTFPGSTERVNFGLVFKANGNKPPRGNLLVMRHLANGDVCRAKSNAIDAPAVVGNSASWSGKGNYNCTRPDGSQYDGAGNQTITGWVEDNGQGSNATGPDKFWVRANGPNSKLLMPSPATANAAPLSGGNIQVPQPGGKK